MKKAIYFISIALFLFIINNFFHSIYSLWQKQDLITSAQKELELEKQEQSRLKTDLSKVQNPAFLEEEARNKLFMVKPGEQIVVLPHTATKPKEVAMTPKKPDPAWLQWYKMIE